MPKIKYINKNFRDDSLVRIVQANQICREYADQGFTLTLRQLYYQFVARGYIPNNDKEYHNLGSLISDARMAGMLDWNYLEDRTRNLRRVNTFESPQDIMRTAADQYKIDLWQDQSSYVECWIEKDALIGVIQVPCEAERVPYFSCRGYTSISEVWSAGRRLAFQAARGKRVVVIHLGDHDPSGIDMSRDIEDRLRIFMHRHADHLEVIRIALNMDQVLQYDPPPNPAKLSDSRSSGYISAYGSSSWELDALSPTVISDLITLQIIAERDQIKWDRDLAREAEEKETLKAISDNWADVRELIDSFN